MLSEISFASYLTYASQGASEICDQSRKICYALKDHRILPNTRTPAASYISGRYAAAVERGEIDEEEHDFLAKDVILVPMPKSSPLVSNTNALWVPREICKALNALGFGARVETLVERVKAVPKSSYAKTAADRASPQIHMESMKATRSSILEERITIVDDVITRGATLLGAASVLRESFPNAEIRGFAFIRTSKNKYHIDSILDPCLGIATMQPDGFSNREP